MTSYLMAIVMFVVVRYSKENAKTLTLKMKITVEELKNGTCSNPNRRIFNFYFSYMETYGYTKGNIYTYIQTNTSTA